MLSAGLVFGHFGAVIVIIIILKGNLILVSDGFFSRVACPTALYILHVWHQDAFAMVTFKISIS